MASLRFSGIRYEYLSYQSRTKKTGPETCVSGPVTRGDSYGNCTKLNLDIVLLNHVGKLSADRGQVLDRLCL
jgi:hypothetical protein